MSSKTIFWEPGEQIPVCFVNGSAETATAEELTKSTVKETYENLIDIKFIGWGKCTDEKKGVKILIVDSPAEDSRPGAVALGKNIEAVLSGGSEFNLALNLSFKNYRNDVCGPQVDRCVKSYALHEFGHVLGLEHESQRPDSTCNTEYLGSPIDTASNQKIFERTTLRTAYDPNSIMNYCKNASDLIEKKDAELSTTDKDILKSIYTTSALPRGFTKLQFRNKEDLPAFSARMKTFFGDAHTIALGEGAHWMQTYHELHFLVMKAAIEDAGFRVIAMELPWSIMAEVNGSINDPKADLTLLMEAFGPFNSPPTMALLQFIRDWNSTHSTDPVIFGGFDAHQPFIDYPKISKYTAKTDPKSVQSLQACSGRESYNSQVEWDLKDGGRVPLDLKNYEICTQTLKSLSAKLKGSNWQLLTHLTSFQAAQDQAFSNTLKAPEAQNMAYATRDVAMKKILDLQSKNAWSNKKQMLWMHVWHASKKTENGPNIMAKSLGSLLSDELGSGFKNILTLAANLEFKGLSVGQFHSAREYPGLPSLEHTLENIRTPYLFVELPESKETFPEDKLFSMESNGGIMFPIKPGSQLDGILFVPFATASPRKK